jgi:hypothetical protein
MVRCVHARQLRCEWVPANAGSVLMMLRVAPGLRAAFREAAVHADNAIGDDGAASLAPSLGRMTQLTSLNLNRTLRACAAAAL